MRIALPSGMTVEVDVPASDFPALIDQAEAREEAAHDDVKLLKRLAKQMDAWPVTICEPQTAEEAEGKYTREAQNQTLPVDELTDRAAVNAAKSPNRGAK